MNAAEGTSTQWGDDHEAPPPLKRGFPKWAWFCGGGCAAIVIIAVVVLGWLYTKFKDAADPEVQWPRLQSVLPFDERPKELTLHVGTPSIAGVQMYIVSDVHGHSASILCVEGKQIEAMRETLLNPATSQLSTGFGKRKDLAAATVHVQGRDLRGVRFTQEGGPDMGGPSSSSQTSDSHASRYDPHGPSIALEVTPEGGSRLVILQLTRSNTTEPVSDDEVRAFLEPFHVGPERK